MRDSDVRGLFNLGGCLGTLSMLNWIDVNEYNSGKSDEYQLPTNLLLSEIATIEIEELWLRGRLPQYPQARYYHKVAQILDLTKRAYRCHGGDISSQCAHCLAI